MFKQIFLLALLTLSSSSMAEAPLTNSDVVRLVKAGLSADVVIQKIKGSQTQFSLDTDSLVALKAAGVPEPVISAMMEQRTAETKAPAMTSLAERTSTTLGDIYKDPRTGLEFRRLPAGVFTMGCSDGDTECESDELPPRRVTIAKPFSMSATEVTNNQFKACIAAGVCEPFQKKNRNLPFDDQTKGEHPVVQISKQDAEIFCSWVGGRLPSEAEWEYAARAGSASRYPWGKEPDISRARFGQRELSTNWDRERITLPVKSFSPNEFGLYDMIGNVWEFVSDDYHETYNGAPTDSSIPWKDNNRFRKAVFRGCSAASPPRDCRVSFRAYPFTGATDMVRLFQQWYYVGFRCAMD
jgi:formylglycine-generating enzyme required for sulfatase activity